jgi:K+-sensing histidine kinase KdpD
MDQSGTLMTSEDLAEVLASRQASAAPTAKPQLIAGSVNGTVARNGGSANAAPGTALGSNGRVGGAILAAIDRSPVATMITEAAARLAAAGEIGHVVHAQEGVTTAEGSAEALVREHLVLLAASHIPAEGHVLLHATDHGTAGRMVAEYANEIGVSTVMVGAPRHRGVSALMDESASAEQRRHARGLVLVTGPDESATRR